MCLYGSEGFIQKYNKNVVINKLKCMILANFNSSKKYFDIIRHISLYNILF